MSEETKFFRREWLNEDEGTGYICITGESYSSDGRSLDVTVEIKDCSRQVSLDFYYTDEESYEKKVKKMERFIAHLNDALTFMKEHPPTPKTQTMLDLFNTKKE